MNTPYYTLVEQEADGEPWHIAFGDYSRQTVDAEMRDLKDRARLERTGQHYRIIRTGDAQAAIDEAVAALNANCLFLRSVI